MEFLDGACNALLGIYFMLALWRFWQNRKEKLLSNSTVLLDTVCHSALILFLFAALRVIRRDHFELKISSSTALSTLGACFSSLVFGIVLGRSWGYAEGKKNGERNDITLSKSCEVSVEKKRVIKSKALASTSSEKNFGGSALPDMPLTPKRNNSRETDDEHIIFEAAETAKSSLLAVLDVSSTASKNSADVTLRNWKLARTGYNSHMWIAKNKTSNIVIKGTCFAALSVASVVKYLFQNGISTGLEGIIGEKETLRTLRRNRVVVSRLKCNMGTFTASKREFLVVTYWAEMENGSVIICTRSLPESFSSSSGSISSSGSGSNGLTDGNGLSAASGATAPSTKQTSKKKGYTRGVIYSSGFVIIPTDVMGHGGSAQASHTSNKRGCQILFSADIDLGGSGMAIRRANHHKADAIIGYVLSLMDQIHSEIPAISISSANDIPPAPGTLLDDVMSGAKPNMTPNSSTTMGLSPDQIVELKNISKDCINRLAVLHASAVDSVNSQPSSSGIAALERKWTTFHDQDGIAISEYCGKDCPVGTLMACCHVNASPQMVRKLLVEFPEYVDTLLEERSVICQLDEKSSIQWIAYGAIWPVGATDFLVVTTECSFSADTLPTLNNPHASHDSIIIASTSVDSVCEDEIETASNGATKEAEESKYNRSELRLAGYTCTPNTKKGGTDVRLFVDVIAATYVPAWLLQMLAQYGLSEMMNRIRVAAPTLAGSEVNGVAPMFKPTSSKLDDMLNLIHSREERMRLQFGDDVAEKQSSSGLDRGASPLPDTTMATTRAARVLSSDSVGTDGGGGNGRTTSDTLPSAVSTRSSSDIEKGLQLAAESYRLIQVYMGHVKDDELVFEWQSKAKKGSIEVSSTPVPGSQWFAIRASTFIPHVNTERLRDFLIDDSNISGYDDMLDTIQPVLRVDERTSIRHMTYKAIWPTAPRDFVVCTTWKEFGNGEVLITSRSAWNELYPSKSGFVRGFLNISGYHISPMSEGDTGCKITMCAHTDLGGTLPSGVINMLSSSAPLKILAAVTALTRDS